MSLHINHNVTPQQNTTKNMENRKINIALHSLHIAQTEHKD